MSNISPIHADDYPYWLALYRVPGVGPVHFSRLLAHFGSPRAVLAANRFTFQELGLKNDALLKDLQNPDWQSVEQDLRWLEQPGHSLLTLQDPRYPPRLREIHDPPPLLFIEGNPALLNIPQLAMVGSRHPTRNGEETAFEFAHYLSQRGLLISSGLAYGIDAASHRGALAGSGKTLGVAATGLDIIYPAKHRELRQEIIYHGILISEYTPGTPVRSHYFPRRNRIISGLSLGVLVVEAALGSGSLLTARLASEQGREVFAIPGSIHNPLAKGCHALLKEGAKLAESANDILEELGSFFKAAPSVSLQNQGSNDAADRALPKHKPKPLNHPVDSILNILPPVRDNLAVDPDYKKLLAQMTVGEVYAVDNLVERSGLTVEVVSSMLLILELQGLISAPKGALYTRLS